MTPETITGLLAFLLVAAVVAASAFAMLYYRDRATDDADSLHRNEVRSLRLALEEAGLLPKANERTLEGPLVRIARQLKGLETMLSDSDVAANLAEYRRQLEQLDRLRAAGPTVVQLDAGDQERLDNLTDLVPSLKQAVDETRERVINLAHLSTNLDRLNGLLGDNLKQLSLLLETQRVAEGPNLERISEEISRMNGHLVQFIKIQQELIIQLSSPQIQVDNERQPLRLIRK